MLRITAAIAALCAIGAFAGFIILRDDNQWRDGDPRHVSRGVFRGAFIALVACCIIIGVCICSAVSAHARPSPYPVTSFEGDRFGARQAQMGADVARDVQRQRAAKKLNKRATAAHRKRSSVNRKRWDGHPMPKPRPGTVDRLSMVGGVQREAGRVAQTLGGRPHGCPARAWCGCYLAKLLGVARRDLWVARNWANVGSNAGGPAPGVVVVWRHHVGIITGRHASGWVVKSGNDGRAVRERVRSIAGAIAYRNPRGA